MVGVERYEKLRRIGAHKKNNTVFFLQDSILFALGVNAGDNATLGRVNGGLGLGTQGTAIRFEAATGTKCTRSKPYSNYFFSKNKKNEMKVLS
jgi:hypothetical protein